MADCNGFSTPVESSCEQSKDESGFLTKEPYREAVGSLNYLAVVLDLILHMQYV